MKLTHLLLSALIATAPVLASGATTEQAPANQETPAAEKATPKKAKPHSHMEEKTGVPQQAPAQAAPSAKPDAAGDANRHLHPRDMK